MIALLLKEERQQQNENQQQKNEKETSWFESFVQFINWQLVPTNMLGGERWGDREQKGGALQVSK